MISLQEAKDYLPVVWTDKDELISSYISFASDFIEKYTGRSFQIRDFEQIKQLSSTTNWISLDHIPLQQVYSLKQFDGKTWQDMDIDFEIVNGMLFVPGGLLPGLYKIYYQAGEEQVNDEIKQVCKILVAWAWNDNPGLTRENASGISQEYLGKVPEEVYNILDKYRNIWLGI